MGSAAAAGAPSLAAVKGAPERATRRAVELVGGMGKFLRAGQRVVVKPNIGWDRSVEQAANTHPEVVTAVVRMCLEAGAGEVMVFDRTCNDQRLCYRRSGIEAAVEGIDDRRVRIFHPDERRYRSVAIPGARKLPTCELYEEALAADVFVNVPIAKHHALTGLGRPRERLRPPGHQTGASAALFISDIPFENPIAAVRVGYWDGQCVVNPSTLELKTKSRLNLLVAGTAEAIVMVESGAQDISEADMVQALGTGHAEIKRIVELQHKLRARVGKPKRSFVKKELDPALRAEIEGALAGPLLEAMRTPGKLEMYARMKAVRDAYLATLGEDQADKRAAVPAVYDGLREKRCAPRS